MPDRNPAKFSAGFRKTPKTWKKTAGSKVLNINRDDERLDHTQANCLCAMSIVFLEHTHSTTQSLEPSSSHFPRPSSEMPKSRTFTKYKQTCAQAKMSKNKPRSMWQGTLLSLQPCLYSSFTKWVALQDFFLPQDFDPLKNWVASVKQKT